MERALDSAPGGRVTWTSPRGGFFLWIELPPASTTARCSSARVKRRSASSPAARSSSTAAATNSRACAFSRHHARADRAGHRAAWPARSGPSCDVRRTRAATDGGRSWNVRATAGAPGSSARAAAGPARIGGRSPAAALPAHRDQLRQRLAHAGAHVGLHADLAGAVAVTVGLPRHRIETDNLARHQRHQQQVARAAAARRPGATPGRLSISGCRSCDHSARTMLSREAT